MLWRRVECDDVVCTLDVRYDLNQLKQCYDADGDGTWDPVPPPPLDDCDPNSAASTCRVTLFTTTFTGVCSFDPEPDDDCFCREGREGECLSHPPGPDCCFNSTEARLEIDDGDYCNEEGGKWNQPAFDLATAVEADCSSISWDWDKLARCDEPPTRNDVSESGCLAEYDPDCDPENQSASSSSAASTYAMYVDPALSTVTVVLGTTSTSAMLGGYAESTSGPDELTVAHVLGDDLGIGTSEYTGWLMHLMSPVAMSFNGQDFTISASEGTTFQGIGFIDGTVQQATLEPSNAITGRRTPSMWEMDYTDSWTGGSLTVHMEGPVYAQSNP